MVMRQIVGIIVLIFCIMSCHQDKTSRSKSKFIEYRKIESLLVNEYNITKAKKLWLSLDSMIDKNQYDSIYWMHQETRIYILMFENYLDSAAILLQNTYPKIDSIKYKELYMSYRNKETMCELGIGHYSQSVKHSFEILPYFEAKEERVARGLKANLGWAFTNLLNWEKAKHYTKEAINSAIKDSVMSLLPDYYQRLANVFASQIQYDSLNKKDLFDSAFHYYNKGKSYLDTSLYNWDLFNLHHNISTLYGLMGMHNEAIIENFKAIKINNSIQDFIGLANCYLNIGSSYIGLKQYKKAIEVLEKTLELNKKHGNVSLNSSVYKNLAVSYKALNKDKEAAEYYEQYVNEYFNEIESNNLKNLKIESQKYETSKAEIEKQLIKNRELKSKSDFQKLLLFSIVILFLIILIFFIWYNKMQLKKKISNIQHQHEKELIQKQTEQNERMRISRNLHDNLGAYASSILNKINVIENDINSKLPHEELSDLKISANQILSNLKNIVIELNQKPLPFIEFMDQIKTELLRLMKSYPDIEFNINEQLEYNSLISPDNQLHLKSIIFEIINNALKHSQAKEINLDISELPENIEIKVFDNGIYSDKINDFNGNGIKNIQTRLSNLNGNLRVFENDKGGTSIMLTIPKSSL